MKPKIISHVVTSIDARLHPSRWTVPPGGARKLAVAFDPHGRVHYGRDEVGGDHAVAVLGEAVIDAYLVELRRDGVSYLFAGPDGHDLASALSTLSAASAP